MREFDRPTERVEPELASLESQTERVECELEDLKESIRELESVIASREQAGDTEIAQSLRQNLADRQQQRREQQEEAGRIAGALQGVAEAIHRFNDWNTEAGRELERLEALGELVEDAASHMADRKRWVDQQFRKYHELQRRIGRILRDDSGRSGILAPPGQAVSDPGTTHSESSARRSTDTWRAPLSESTTQMQGNPRETKERSLAGREHLIEGTRVRMTWVDAAAERLRHVAGLRPDNWSTLDIHGKRTTLNKAGRILGELYDHPSPPLLVEDLGDPRLQGQYGDGHFWDEAEGRVRGGNYGTEMNVRGVDDEGDRLFGEDPAVALRTYVHEFRHSYQKEQVNRYKKPQLRNLVDNRESAQEWDHEYIPPVLNYEAYRAQPVEKDARRFAEELIRRLYHS